MKNPKTYIRVYRYNYQNRLGIVGLNQKTLKQLFPVPNKKGVGGPFYFEITAKPVTLPKVSIRLVRVE